MRRSIGVLGRARLLAGVLLFSCGLAVSACGIAAQSSPVLVPAKTVPYGLLTKTQPATPVAAPSEYVTIYLYGGERLVAVSRGVAKPATLQSVLDSLARGPTSAEASLGLASPVSTATPLGLDTRAQGAATVNVARSFTDLSGQQQVVAAAQLVYTLTAFPGVGSVSVRIDGRAAQVPTASGKLTRGPLVRADFASLAPI